MDLSHPPWPRWQLAAIAAVTAAVAAMLAVYLASLRSSGPARPAVTAPYTWPHGTPAGITLSELQDYEVTRGLIVMMKKQIRAAADYWHANTVRFQILQDRLVGAEGRWFDRRYMAAIRVVTDYALHLGLTVVLNAQTELTTGYAVDEPLPTHATQVFWQRMMDVWRNNPRIVFDLFNEPRRCTWAQWQSAFQHLINYIRGRGAGNQLWVEGRWWGSTFAGVPLLHGTGIVYSFHHPGSPWPWQRPVDRQTWYRAFGFLAQRGLPVVDGEFPNYVGSYDWGPDSRRAPSRARPGVFPLSDRGAHRDAGLVAHSRRAEQQLGIHVHQPRAARRRATGPRLAGRHRFRQPLGQVAGPERGNLLTD